MTGKHPQSRLLVFAKAPVPGQVKTRLIPALGTAGAAALQRQLLERTLEMACDTGLARVELWLAGQMDHPGVGELVRRFRIPVYGQQGAHLGERMAHAIAEQAQTEQKRLLIGTDCPLMDGVILQQALAALESTDVVFQPAEDGGYTLIGMKQTWPALFEDIHWGGSQVMGQSLARAQALGLSVTQLSLGWDLDRPEDYRRAVQEGCIRPVAGAG